MSTETFPCDPCCGGELTDCCDNTIPITLTALITITSAGACLAAWDGTMATLTFNAGTSQWEGTATPGCGETMDIAFYCDSEAGDDCEAFRLDWDIPENCTSPTGETELIPDGPGQCTCDPVDADFSTGFDSSCDCCDENGVLMTITITE